MINQYREQNCVTLDKSVWKKKNRTVSQWINQSEMKPFQRIGKRDKPVVKKICYIKVDCCIGEIVFRTMMYLLMKFRKSQTKLSRNSRKISLQFQRISNMESGICMIVERREIIQEKRQKKFYKSHQIVLLLMVVYFFGWSYTQLLKAAERQAS